VNGAEDNHVRETGLAEEAEGPIRTASTNPVRDRRQTADVLPGQCDRGQPGLGAGFLLLISICLLISSGRHLTTMPTNSLEALAYLPSVLDNHPKANVRTATYRWTEDEEHR